MQLFILDHIPKNAASMLCDQHLRKMCLETAQILSSVMFLHGVTPVDGMPKPYNPHHPVIAALDNQHKINWTVLYNEALQREFLFRFGKAHAYAGLTPEYRKALFRENLKIRMEKLSFARDFKDIYIFEPDIVKAYRIYYKYKKSILKRWSYTNTKEPDWLTTPDFPG